MKRKILQAEKSDIPFKSKKNELIDEIKENLDKDDTLNIKRKKKRKHESNKEFTENDTQVESKKIETMINEKGLNGNSQETYSEASDQEELQEVGISLEESDKFNGKLLRNSFNSAEGFAILQKFVTICKKTKKDLAAEYLEAGGSVLEILRLLDTSEKKNIHNAATVFTAMHIVIIKVLDKYPQNQSSAQEACRHFINSHLASVHSMLSSESKVKHRKIVLRLLAAIVSLGGTLPRELLNHLSLHSQLVDALVTHSKPSDSQSVRTCFIHFILAFLIDGSPSDIRALLEKRGVLSSIFSGLIYDYSDVVKLVLTTVKKFILENPVITKTTKLHVFSTPVVQSIVNLYNWKGPKNWPGHKREKLQIEHFNQEEKEITLHCVHEFLITLLTSKKHGIAFQDKSLGVEPGHKHNQLINSILQSLDKPWEHEKPSELVVKILTACPDLIKSQLINAEPYLLPRVSKKWIAVIQFIMKIINGIDLDNCLKLYSTEITVTQMTNAVMNLIIPSVVVKSAIIPALNHDNAVIHHEIICLVLTMIKKIDGFIKKFENIKLNTTDNFVFKSIILELILKNMPSFESILTLWIKAFKPNTLVESSETDEKDLHISLKIHLLEILNLLQAYCEICPEMLLTVGVASMPNKPTVLLTNLCKVPDVTDEELTAMKVKALKILLCSNVSSFSPDEDIFSIALTFLMTKVGDDDNTLDFEVRQTINMLFNQCGIFEEYNDQIEIWINGITHLDTYEEKLEVADWIIKLIRCVSKNTNEYISLIHITEESIGQEVLDNNRQKKIFDELSKKNIEDVTLITPMLPVTSIPLILYAAIENLKKTDSTVLANYISVVLVHTLHFQISPKVLISLIEKLKIPAQKYLLSWLNNGTSISIKKPFESKSIFRILSTILLNSKKIKEISVVDKQLKIELTDDSLIYSLTNFELKALFRMLIFYLVQLLQKCDEKIQNIDIYKRIILSLFIIAKEMDHNSNSLLKECAKWVFKHPILLQYFKVIYKSDVTIEFEITQLFLELHKLFFDSQKQFLLPQFLQPYQEKVVQQIKSAIQKQTSSGTKKELKILVEFIEFLQLDINTIVDLLAVVIDLPKEKFTKSNNSALSIWGIIIPKLIDQFSIKGANIFISIQDNVLKKLFYYLTNLKVTCKEEIACWEISLYEYLMKFPNSISAVEDKVFVSFMQTEISPATKKLLNLLIERNPKFITVFIRYVNKHETILEQKNFVISMLSSNLENKWDIDFLNKIFKLCNKEIIYFLTDPNVNESSWIQEYLDAVLYLIETTFDSNLCKETCNIILSNGHKLDNVQENHVKLYFALFKKSLGANADALKDFVQLLLYITVTALKKDSKNVKKLDFFCKTIIDAINILKLDNEFLFEELNKNHSWPQFTRIILKSGLKIPKEDKNKTVFLLKALSATCDVAYKDNINEEYVKTIFEMTTSHSEFVNIMLSNSNIKSDLAELLWILTKKNKDVMTGSHLPLYLSSYNATLSLSDQCILKILQHYENSGIKLDEYRPYLWGSAAALHYSVKGEADTALWRQPTTSQVLDLLDHETVVNTIKYYPIQRNLKCIDVYEGNVNHQVYDPAFYLPVLNHLLVENNVIACYKVVHSGALALAIIACSGTCEQIRLAAFTVLSRFYFHLEATSSKEKLMWINFIELLRNGINQTELPLEKVQLNGFSATFLAHACLVMTQPLNPLYFSLQTFLMAKPALDLNIIPEFFELYHSSDIKYKAHRQWILEVIFQGLKTNEDMDVALKCALFKMLLDFYNSTLCDRLAKNLILKIIESATKLRKPCLVLITGYALLPWLNNITENIMKGEANSISSIICIINNIVVVLQDNKIKESLHYLMSLKILLQLRKRFDLNLTEESLKKYIQVLNKTIVNNVIGEAFVQDDLKSLIDFSKTILKDVSECEAMLQFGCKFVKKINVQNDNELSSEESLRKLIMNWSHYYKHNK